MSIVIGITFGLLIAVLLLLLLLLLFAVRVSSMPRGAETITGGERLPGTFAALVAFFANLCICRFKGDRGLLTVDPSCCGILSLWVIPENGTAPAFTPATAGTTYDADGFVIGGVVYKVDGSTCVTIRCSGGSVVFDACVNLIALALGKKAPYRVPAGTFANEPAAGAAAAPVS